MLAGGMSETERIDYEAEGLLADVSTPAERASRVALLDELIAAGVGVDTLREAIADQRLATLPLELVLLAGCDRTLRQVLEEAGLSEEYARRHYLALGLPMPDLDEKAFGETDAVAWGMLKRYFDAGFTEDAILDLVRASGRGAAHTAAVAMDHTLRLLLRRGDTEHDFGARLARLGVELIPSIGPLSEAPLRWHLRDRIRREVIGEAERRTGQLTGTRDVAVAFVDLVDFTRLSADLSPDRLSDVMTRFEHLAADVADARVHLVKLIGDGAMLVSDDPVALVEAVWALVRAACDDAGLPAARAGAAFGSALHRGGDWFGRPVNLASRVTGAAEPGAVFADDLLARRSSAVAAWVPAGVKHLRGIDEPVALYRLRPERTGAGG
jgi:adenylate cyclase